MKVGLFIPCYINAIYPNVGVASYKLLKSLGVDVDYPLDQTCCGQPMANAGLKMNQRSWHSVLMTCFNNMTTLSVPPPVVSLL